MEHIQTGKGSEGMEHPRIRTYEGWSPQGVGRIQDEIHAKWNAHVMERTRSRTLTEWDIERVGPLGSRRYKEWNTRSGTHAEWYTTRIGTYAVERRRSRTHREWDIQGMDYTEWNIDHRSLITDGIYTERDAQGVGGIRSGTAIHSRIWAMKSTVSSATQRAY